jgi:hypothetical protein
MIAARSSSTYLLKLRDVRACLYGSVMPGSKSSSATSTSMSSKAYKAHSCESLITGMLSGCRFGSVLVDVRSPDSWRQAWSTELAARSTWLSFGRLSPCTTHLLAAEVHLSARCRPWMSVTLCAAPVGVIPNRAATLTQLGGSARISPPVALHRKK